jgi:hypothetical protein
MWMYDDVDDVDVDVDDHHGRAGEATLSSVLLVGAYHHTTYSAAPLLYGRRYYSHVVPALQMSVLLFSHLLLVRIPAFHACQFLDVGAIGMQVDAVERAHPSSLLYHQLTAPYFCPYAADGAHIIVRLCLSSARKGAGF